MGVRAHHVRISPCIHSNLSPNKKHRFQNIVPISLYISIEVVRTAQAAFIYFDREIYYAKTDTPALCRTSSLVEELGQIEYVFSDKTGTLTCNEMEFRFCSIAGVAYADVVEESRRGDGEDGKDGWRSFAEMKALLGGAQDLALAGLVALRDLAGSAGGGPHIARPAASGGEHLPIG